MLNNDQELLLHNYIRISQVINIMFCFVLPSLCMIAFVTFVVSGHVKDSLMFVLNGNADYLEPRVRENAEYLRWVVLQYTLPGELKDLLSQKMHWNNPIIIQSFAIWGICVTTFFFMNKSFSYQELNILDYTISHIFKSIFGGILAVYGLLYGIIIGQETTRISFILFLMTITFGVLSFPITRKWREKINSAKGGVVLFNSRSLYSLKGQDKTIVKKKKQILIIFSIAILIALFLPKVLNGIIFNNPEQLIAQAKDLSKASINEDKAITLYERALRINPAQDKSVYFNLTTLYLTNRGKDKPIERAMYTLRRSIPYISGKLEKDSLTNKYRIQYSAIKDHLEYEHLREKYFSEKFFQIGINRPSDDKLIFADWRKIETTLEKTKSIRSIANEFNNEYVEYVAFLNNAPVRTNENDFIRGIGIKPIYHTYRETWYTNLIWEIKGKASMLYIDVLFYKKHIARIFVAETDKEEIYFRENVR